MKTILGLILLFCLLPLCSKAQSFKPFDNILYGVAYYHGEFEFEWMDRITATSWLHNFTSGETLIIKPWDVIIIEEK